MRFPLDADSSLAVVLDLIHLSAALSSFPEDPIIDALSTVLLFPAIQYALLNRYTTRDRCLLSERP